MKILYFLILICLFFPLQVVSKETFLSLKKNKVNVRYGPSFETPIKYIYKKINLPIKQIDKKENWRRIIDFKNNSGWIHWSQLKKTNSIIPLEDKILFIQTPTTLETVDLSEVEAISYRMTIEDFTYLKPYLFGLSGFIGLGMAQVYNSQRSIIYNEYGIARTDLNRYTQLYGIVIGLIFSSELFDAVSTFLTPSETFILSKETYDAQI